MNTYFPSVASDGGSPSSIQAGSSNDEATLWTAVATPARKSATAIQLQAHRMSRARDLFNNAKQWSPPLQMISNASAETAPSFDAHTNIAAVSSSRATTAFKAAVTVNQAPLLKLEAWRPPPSIDYCNSGPSSLHLAGRRRGPYNLPHELGHPCTCSFCLDASAFGRFKQAESRFNCGTCGRGFKLRWLLKRHERIHAVDKPYKCEVCARGFARSDCLKTHLRIHTGEKPFVCKHCNGTFRDGSNLRQHVRAVHSDQKPYQCTVCGLRSSNRTNLKAHYRRAHSSSADSTANHKSARSV